MKHYIVAVLLILSTQLSQAGSMKDKEHYDNRQPPTVEQRVQRMDKALDLSDEQKSQITAILNSREQEKQELKEKLREIHQQELTEISAILNDKQKKKFAKKQMKKYGN